MNLLCICVFQVAKRSLVLVFTNIYFFNPSVLCKISFLVVKLTVCNHLLALTRFPSQKCEGSNKTRALTIHYPFMKTKKFHRVCPRPVSVRETGVGLPKIHGIIVIVLLSNPDSIVDVKFDVRLGCRRERKGEANN